MLPEEISDERVWFETVEGIDPLRQQLPAADQRATAERVASRLSFSLSSLGFAGYR